MSERFKLIAEGLDVAPLLAKIAEHPELWLEHTERQNFPGSPHKDTETIYLRWARDQSLAGGFYDLTCEDHVETINKLGPEAINLCGYVISKLIHDISMTTQQVGRVIITRMKPGGVITPHVDEGPYADRYDRFHVTLAGRSTFTCGGETVMMDKPGSVWWFNHKLEHSVHNFTINDLRMVDRIHLIIDAEAPEYRKLRGLTFQRERAVDLWDEIIPLLEKHYEEICHYKDLKLNPDVEAYNTLDEGGVLRCFTARLNGDLIGYCMFFVKPNLHYRDSLQALQDVLFILPEHRGSRAGLKLVQFCEERLRQEGAQIAYQHIKVKTPKTIELFRKLGYEDIDLIMGKRLDR